MTIQQYTDAAIALLKQLITIPSPSREEEKTADVLELFLRKHHHTPTRIGNNVILNPAQRVAGKPTVLLNSHHDTVKPAKGWKRNPFSATLEEDQLFGLGSNDAGASLVSLLATYLYCHNRPECPVNLVWVGSAEEEISGPNGMVRVIDTLGKIDAAIVGEPTQMQMAIAEKGLMVLDGEAKGQAGHAARNEGVNALYIALDDIATIRSFPFDRTSAFLGATQATVTQIEAGYQHNVVPDRCTFVVDVRTNEHYTNQEVHQLLQQQVKSTLTPRSYRLNSSSIPQDHPLVVSGQAMGLSAFGSPTLSDQALMPYPSLKMGPGDSARSHTADEYIFLSEIREGIRTYIELLTRVSHWKT